MAVVLSVGVVFIMLIAWGLFELFHKDDEDDGKVYIIKTTAKDRE